ncbi:transcription initiation factor IID, 31kD subunit-domain-containing protein [Gaertneriomyces semiglobifer]|nr:transcription initiation factor IID, 31kD subunit-domain-containing protein [Gaertneriomyces semiglobifer]
MTQPIEDPASPPATPAITATNLPVSPVGGSQQQHSQHQSLQHQQQPADPVSGEFAALAAASAAHGRQDAVDLPRDAKLVSLILQGMGVNDFEPRVVIALLEFIHRYTLDVLSDSQTYADHAGRGTITVDDVKIAIASRAATTFTAPPGREVLEQLAAKKNAAPLPVVANRFGVRLPPERHTLTGSNFQIGIEVSVYVQSAVLAHG